MLLKQKITITKALFALGILLQFSAQLMFPLSNSFNFLEPIDFIHWTLLLGVVLIIPGTLKFSRGFFSKTGVIIAFMGIIAQIGMCAIDFVLWSYRNDNAARNKLINHLQNEPSIWEAFITIGPTLTFFGFVIISYTYFKTNLKGFITVNIGATLAAIGGLILPELTTVRILGFLIFFAGLLILSFQRKNQKINYQKIYKILFVIGLLFEAIGQILMSKGNDFVYALEPIDFTHWFLLLGAVLMTPQIVNSPKKIYSFIGVPTAMIGVVCMIGMCVLDFMWWSMPTQEMRSELAGHLSQFPSIWDTFITTGTVFLNIGLFFLSLNYFKQHKIGALLVILATLIIFVGGFIPHRLILVYLMTAIGFAMIFFKTTTNEQQTK